MLAYARTCLCTTKGQIPLWPLLGKQNIQAIQAAYIVKLYSQMIDLQKLIWNDVLRSFLTLYLPQSLKTFFNFFLLYISYVLSLVKEIKDPIVF